jgi:hypothetical protein
MTLALALGDRRDVLYTVVAYKFQWQSQRHVNIQDKITITKY